MPTVLLRFPQLKERGICASWPQLIRLQKLEGFPRGFLISSNTRVWTETSVEDWISSRPVERTTTLRGVAALRRGRPRKITTDGDRGGLAK
jgi:predicted DNA-binding transcriptional regulator AlpA